MKKFSLCLLTFIMMFAFTCALMAKANAAMRYGIAKDGETLAYFFSKTSLEDEDKIIPNYSEKEKPNYVVNNANDIKHIVINDASSIGEYSFAGLDKATDLYIDSTVTEIGAHAFEKCTNLTSVTFGENSQLTKIDSYAFGKCLNLTTIEIPASVEYIAADAFECCDKLSTIIVHTDALYVDPFFNHTSAKRDYDMKVVFDNMTITFPKEAVDNYDFYTNPQMSRIQTSYNIIEDSSTKSRNLSATVDFFTYDNNQFIDLSEKDYKIKLELKYDLSLGEGIVVEATDNSGFSYITDYQRTEETITMDIDSNIRLNILNARFAYENVVLSEGINYRIYANIDVNHMDDVFVIFTIHGNQYKAFPVQYEDLAYFECYGIAPHLLDEKIVAKLYINGNEVDSYGNNLRTYLESAVFNNQYASDATKQLASNLLDYCISCREYTGETGTPSNTHSVLSYVATSEELANVSNKKSKTETTLAGAEFKSIGVEWNNLNRIYVKFIYPEGKEFKLKINGAIASYEYNSTTQQYIAFTRGIKPTEYDDEFVFEIYNEEGRLVQKLTYSFNSYLSTRFGDSKITLLARLAKDAYEYGKVAKEYASNNN